MRIAGTLSCSFCNGDGTRYVIFTQGCKHACKGCQNPETWNFTGGYEKSIQSLLDDIQRHPMIDGITLSGGDPFYQQEECIELLKRLPENLDIWIYTGFHWNEVKNTKLADYADVIVSEPFVQELLCTGKMYGSSNQQIHRKKDGKWQD